MLESLGAAVFGNPDPPDLSLQTSPSNPNAAASSAIRRAPSVESLDHVLLRPPSLSHAFDDDQAAVECQLQPQQGEEEDEECDVDTNPTTLYKLLERSEWDRAAVRARTHPAEARTWIARTDDGSLRWRLLPLHAAVMFAAPRDTVKSILDAHPAAARSTDDGGMLPLHLAMRNIPVKHDVADVLLASHPAAAQAKDDQGRTPFALMARPQQAADDDDVGLAAPPSLLRGRTASSEDQASQSRRRSCASPIPPSPVTTPHLLAGPMTPLRDSGDCDLWATAQSPVADSSFLSYLSPSRHHHALSVSSQRQVHFDDRVFLPDKFSSRDEDDDDVLTPVEEDFEARISRMKKAFDRELDSVRREHDHALLQQAQVHGNEMSELRARHDESMDAMRDSLVDELGARGETHSALTHQIDELRTQLRQSQEQNEMYRTVVEGMKMQRAQLVSEMTAMSKSHDRLLKKVLRQRKEVEASLSTREKLLEQMLEQAKEDRIKAIRGGEELIDTVTTSRKQIDDVVRRLPSHDAGAMEVGIGRFKPPSRGIGEGLGAGQLDGRHRHRRTATSSTFGGDDEHKDDMSALTENTHLE